ncbi:molybdopterin-guanine dinucleotide biosynthesis protein B [bacterium]|nr:molybdopterin-guanine dinucleotide biosynthesis protein B [bacterium]
MRAFQVCGYTGSGKTTLVTALIRHLRHKGFRVASVKDIHAHDFSIDTPGKNTWLHKQAGADPVVARSAGETDFLYTGPMDLTRIRSLISADWLIVEGYHDFPLPRIVCASSSADAEDYFDGRTFALAGAVSGESGHAWSLPVFNALDECDLARLADLVEERVFPMLPYVDDACCGRCGLTCAALAEAIMQGRRERSACVLDRASVRLNVGGRDVPMVPFVQQILRNTVIGVASELKGWRRGASVEITIDGGSDGPANETSRT